MKTGWMLVLVFTLILTSCSETNEVTEYIIYRPLSECEKKLVRQGAKFMVNGEDDSIDWFFLTKGKCLEDHEYRIRKYTGRDCYLNWDAVFVPEKEQELNLQADYKFVPLSADDFCTLEQNGKTMVLHFKKDYKPCD